jgi:ABC-2 type transport system ATP-binding protein
MLAGIRTNDLRKVYNSPPPLAAGGGLAFNTTRGKKNKQPRPEIVALDGLSLEIAPGEIFGLLGPNGAGKSTTVGILTTRVRPTGGQAWIGELDVWGEQVAVKRLIGVVAQRPNLDFSLTALISVSVRWNGRSARMRCWSASNSRTAPIRWCAVFRAA